ARPAALKAKPSDYGAWIIERRRPPNAKRRIPQPIALDDYVLTQPPVYTGPKRPPGPPPEPPPEIKPRPQKIIPSVADVLKAASDFYQWAPQQPANEVDFKRAYARYAIRAGLTPEQAVRVYAFEAGGDGTPDTP